MDIAIVTGASRGLGLALTRALVDKGWSVVVDARGGEALAAAVGGLGGVGHVVPIVGDVAASSHREALVDAAARLGGLDLLVNNAGILGPSPQPALADYPLRVLRNVFEVNVVAPVGLTQLALPLLRERGGAVVNITSDASVEAYEGWGGYGSAKAALDHAGRVLAVEEPGVRVYSVDPGDMRTQMHQDAFPGEDISDRPLPEESVPGLLRLVSSGLPSGRYRVSELVGVGA